MTRYDLVLSAGLPSFVLGEFFLAYPTWDVLGAFVIVYWMFWQALLSYKDKESI